MTKPVKHVLIMAGGTGGHVFPGLAVADFLKEQGVNVSWLGTAHGLEASVVPKENIPLHTIAIKGLRGKGALSLLLAPFKVMRAIIQARCIINKVKPDIVLGMGGFASGPGGVAAFLSGIPLVVHEQNARAGMTNKMLAYLAKYVLTGFPGAFAAREKVKMVGNPARKKLEQLLPPETRLQNANKQLHLLVLGGSLGAKAINELLPAAIAQLPEDKQPAVWHQSGEKHFAAVKDSYQQSKQSVTVTPFIEDMAEAYNWADLVICRAGALTVSELCAVGLGAVFVPFPHAVDDHQTANAGFMVRQGAALCVQQKALTVKKLSDIIEDFVNNRSKCREMALAAYRLRKADVPKQIFAILGEAVS